MQKNLIIGAATGYKYADMKYFFTSLKHINFKGDVAILVSDQVDEETRNSLEAQGVNLIYVKSSALSFSKKYANSRLWKIHGLAHKLLFRLLNGGQNKLSRLSKYVKIFHLISGSRYCYYYDYLLKNQPKYKFVLITDVRDVVFQADPFAAFCGDDALNFYAEENSIENSFYTSYWIKHAFGKSAWRSIKNKISICSGTTIGAIGPIITYLEQMIITQAKITAGLTGLGGFDQGVHNYLAHNNFFPGANIVTNATGEVATLGETTVLARNENLELTGAQGRVIPVVHQFDRFPEMKLKALT